MPGLSLVVCHSFHLGLSNLLLSEELTAWGKIPQTRSAPSTVTTRTCFVVELSMAEIPLLTQLAYQEEEDFLEGDG
jgi:hypothetical protein